MNPDGIVPACREFHRAGADKSRLGFALRVILRVKTG
jgi:hypothetical protein